MYKSSRDKNISVMFSAKSVIKSSVIHDEEVNKLHSFALRDRNALVRSRFDRGMRSQFCDRVIAIGMRSPFISYHRDADGYSGERFCSSSPYGGERESRGPRAIVNENVGRSLEIAFDSISDPSGGVRHGTRNYVTAILARRAGYFYFILTHVRIIDSRIHAAAIVALLLLRGEVRLQGMK